ncbi:arylsulfatase [Rubritalea spongiae]|uniref:Arylsulfatase n=1 Tax=Rubritalea spongiae TaxID=430797 RepID=A0ABW5DZZ3_9BACT
MRRTTPTLLLSFLSSVCICNAQLLDVGSIVGIDFSNAAGSATHWNTLGAPNSSSSSLVATDGTEILGLSIATTGATGSSALTSTSPSFPDIPSAVQNDWWYETASNGQMVFTISGLDNGLIYQITLGCYRPDATEVQADNADSTWIINGNTMVTDALEAATSYVTFSELSPTEGSITITTADNANGNTINVISGLKMEVTGGEQTLTLEDVTPQVQANPLFFTPSTPAEVDSTPPTKKPNVIIIYADDLGYGDISCQGATKMLTPNIDQLAIEGRRFTDAHSGSAVCCPSRYSLLTGRYPFRDNLSSPIPPNQPLLFDDEIKTVSDVMKEAGYTTSLIGKWHLGFNDFTQGNTSTIDPKWNYKLSPGPLEVGFDYYYGVPVVNSAPPYVFVENHYVVGLDPNDPFVYEQRANTENQTDWGAPNRGGKVLLSFVGGAEQAHLLYRDKEVGTHLAGKAKQWLTENHKDPFFMIYATTAIHHPFTPAEQFEGTSLAGIYGDFVHELDWLVGDLINHLQQLGVYDETLIIFTSDNGGMANEVGQFTISEYGHRLNGPYLGYKFGVWEGGHRVPFIVRWPGKVPANTVSDDLISSVDMMQTMASILDVELEADDAIDSYNITPALVGSPETPVRDVMFYSPSTNQHRAIRKKIGDGDWVYIPGQKDGGFSNNVAATALSGHVNSDIVNGSIRSGAPSRQLYNLAIDPYQEVNVIEDPENSEVLAELEALRAEFLASARTSPIFDPVELLSPIADIKEDYQSTLSGETTASFNAGLGISDSSSTGFWNYFESNATSKEDYLDGHTSNNLVFNTNLGSNGAAGYQDPDNQNNSTDGLPAVGLERPYDGDAAQPSNALIIHPGHTSNEISTVAQWTSGVSEDILIIGSVSRGRNLELLEPLDLYIIKTAPDGSSSEVLFEHSYPAGHASFGATPFNLETSVESGERIHFVVNGNGSFSRNTTNLSAGIYRADSDGDGLNDLFEANLTSDLTTLNAEDDFDGDQFNNLQEQTLGTDPTDGTDYFRITNKQMLNSDGSVTLEWPIATGNQYTVERSLSAHNFSWHVVATDVEGGTWTDNTAERAASDRAFYRVYLQDQ